MEFGDLLNGRSLRLVLPFDDLEAQKAFVNDRKQEERIELLGGQFVPGRRRMHWRSDSYCHDLVR